METVADRIRWILETRGLSARALSKRAGLADGHVSMILRGLVGKGVTAETLAQIARAGGVNAGWLATGEGSALDAPHDPAPYTTPDRPPLLIHEPSEPSMQDVPEPSEMPETLGQRRDYMRQEAAAKRELAKRDESVEEWVWPHVRATNNFTLDNSPPGVAMLCELAKFIANYAGPAPVRKK